MEGRRKTKGRPNISSSVLGKRPALGRGAVEPPGSWAGDFVGRRTEGEVGVLGSLQVPETVACSW